MTNRLEALELQGVKTFATLTRLEFPGKITAIVGPNGSGKSNIADSIRWVLGEQSYSLLRAKRTEDMIFSGSQQRSRAGMASATITFNNEDGWLPIEFSEVSISRQASRDGQNEYLLNGQKVRLKDISELLAQTGLAERTYTVIGQGLVDVALALKPDERRKLFEEAAGIGLYRSRKEESLRRLENTRKNLDRVLDIMTEIRPRLRSLERQAERFQVYEQLRLDLQALLKEWYGYHWHQKQQDLRTSRFAYQDQEKRLGTLRGKKDEAESRLAEAREALQEKRKLLEDAHSQMSGLHRELELVTRELAIIEERERSYRSQMDHIDIDLAHLGEELKQLEVQEKKFQADIVERRGEFNTSTSELNRINEELTILISQRERVQEEIDANRQTRVALETEKVQRTAKREALVNRVGTLDSERSKLTSTLETLELQLQETQKQSEILKEHLKAEETNLQTVQEELEVHNHRLDDFLREKEEINQALADQERERAKRAAELDVLQQAEAALSGYSEGSKKLVERSRQGQLPPGIVPLSQHIIVEQAYEKAISAALGELADLLVVPSQDKEIVIEYLDTKENDRVALIIPDLVSSKMLKKRLADHSGVIGFASDLVEVDSPYRTLVENLFADTVVVRDRKSAQALSKALEGSEKAVTLNGMVFQANGVMISGQGASGKRLGRTRRQSEIQLDIRHHTSLITELEGKLSAVSENIANQVTVREVISERIKAQSERTQSVREELQKTQDQNTRLTEQIRWHKSQSQTLEENLHHDHQTILEIDEKLKSLSAAVSQKTAQEQDLRMQLAEFPVLDQQQTLNQWQTQKIVVENALRAAQQRFQDHQGRMDEVRKRLETTQGRLQELTISLEALRNKKALLKDAMETLNEKIQDIEDEQIKPLAALAESLENQAAALEKMQTHSHQQVVAAERQFTQLQLQLSRREDQISTLQARIEDDFGLVAYDYDPKIDGPTPLPFGESLIEDLPRVESLPKIDESEIKRLKGQIRRIGSINPEAQQEYIEVKERHEFLTTQITDLEKASDDLRHVIEELDSLMERDFIRTFNAVRQEFSEYFARLFNGGEAKLVFSDAENPVEGGVDIEARLPGRRQQGLALLSGGERSLTAVALIFALLKVSPTPFCILDEVDAMLDESNVGRFVDLLKELARKTQFVIITHNRNTVQAADVIYGVTMGRDSTSQMISLKLEEVDETYLE